NGASADNDFHPAPVWLTESYLEPILQRSRKDNSLHIVNLDIKPATAKGDNYASIMTRVKVDYTLNDAQQMKSEFFIVKTTYEYDPFISNIFAGYQASQTEMMLYDKILPQLSELLEQTELAEKLFAQTLHVDYERSAIIFEDLAVDNYVLGNRLTGFDLEHTKLALRKLAKMHATSAVFNERQPDLLTKLDHGIFNNHSRGFSPMFEGFVEVAAEFAGSCPELGSVYQQKLQRLQKHIMRLSEKVYEPQPNEFNILTHGDFWTNNIMLRKQTADQPLDMLLIDFQFAAWASPAVDLHYFLNTSLETEVRMAEHDALIQYYHSVLVQTLRALNFTGHIPTLRQLRLQIEKGGFMAVTATLTCQAIMLNDETADADFNSLMKVDERARNFKRTAYKNKRLQGILKQLLPVYDHCGLLDLEP
ncbi:CG10513, partial [Drosophila busckii]